MNDTPEENKAAQQIAEMHEFIAENQRLIRSVRHDHMATMVLNHEQQIKDLAAHLLELKQLVTPMMEVKRREWVGLTEDEMQTAYRKIDDWNACLAFIDSKLREKNA